jgi:vancomycin resistance protein YoaR
MARSFTSRDQSSLLPNGWSTPWATLRTWSATTAHRLRRSVLPEVESEADAPDSQPEGEGTPKPSLLRTVVFRRLVPALMWIVLLLAVGLVVFRVAYADRVYPAVVVGDVPVGGLTVNQAEAKLTERADQLENGTFTFTYKGQVWTPSLSELGVNVMLDESIADARQLGRGGNSTSRLGFVGNILEDDQVVPLQTSVDKRVLNTWFDSVDQDIDNLPVNPQLKVDGTAVQVVPGSDGIVVDREAATAQLLATLDGLEPVSTTMPTMVAHPDFTAEDLGPAEKQVTEALSEPVPVTFEKQNWKVEGKDLGPFVTIEVVLEHGKPAAKLAVDRAGLAAELRSRYSDEINRKPTDAVFGWDDKLVALEPGTYGAALRSDAFADAVADSFLNGHGSVEIPVVSIAPEVDDTRLDEYGIAELLGGGHSNFAGGAWQRDQNIYVATELLNHTLVAPGETFSFNKAIGEITADKGYEEAEVVVAEQVGRDIGGGVCQVSTTVFRAAINSGMPIDEWHPHTYRLSNYERDGWGPGFDASILQIGPDPDDWADFKFENYTDHWLLVESYASDAHVYVNFYGTSDGRDVDIEAWPIGGNAFGFTRTIYDKTGEVIADRSFESYFK